MLSLVSACSSGGGSANPAAGFPPPEVTAAKTMASRAVMEADSVAGLPLGATRDQAAAVLGNPTTVTSEGDSAGSYEAHRWQLSGNRGLALSFRAGSRYTPGLTDWRADINGPRTIGGVQVGDTTDEVVAAYGPLAAFCCAAKVAMIERGGGKMIVIVRDNTGLVDTIVSGDPAAWMRTIED